MVSQALLLSPAWLLDGGWQRRQSVSAAGVDWGGEGDGALDIETKRGGEK